MQVPCMHMHAVCEGSGREKGAVLLNGIELIHDQTGKDGRMNGRYAHM